jgi:glycerol-3-phosphate dehydrogenase
MLVEKEHDVALHTSGRNDGMVHSGLDLRKGQLKKEYNDKGNRMYPAICGDLDVPFKRTGQYLCFTKGWMKLLGLASLLYWKLKGITAKFVCRSCLFKREPHLSRKIKFALFFPDSGVVSPYGLTIAYAENAADNGVKFYFDTAVTGMEINRGRIESVMTNNGRIYPKLVINAAGVFSEDIAIYAQDHFFSIHPRRGTNIILDKKYSAHARTIVSILDGTERKSSKKGHTKGGGIIHTIDDNLLIGPDAVETYEKENFSTNTESIRSVLEKQKKTLPALGEHTFITSFTGVRAATYEEDFIVSFGKFTKNIIHAAGIQSPGLTAAPAIAADISRMAAEYLLASINEKFNPKRKGIVRAAALPADERDALIKSEPEYGEIICRCEEISRGEVLAAMRRSLPCDTMDGIKRRVRPGMGRCQGSFCGPQVLQIIAAEKCLPLSGVKKMSDNSELLFGCNKGFV